MIVSARARQAFYEVGSFFGELVPPRALDASRASSVGTAPGPADRLNLLPGWQEFLGVSKQRAVTTEAVVYSEVRGAGLHAHASPVTSLLADRRRRLAQRGP